MFFSNPWGLLGLLALPVIVGIHLFQRRFPQLDVAGLHLWDLDIKVKKSGRRVDRLPVSRTLLLELLCGLALTLLLAQPRISTTSSLNRWIIVLDNSASMSASLRSGKSFKQRAIDAIESRVGTSGNAEVTILLTGRRPTTLAGPRVSWTDANVALNRWQPSDRLHGFQSAWDMASELAGNQDRLLFVTDHLPANEIDLPARMSVAAVGEALDNVCFEIARWTRGADGEKDQLYLRVSNQSDIDQSATLIGKSGSSEIFRQSVQMKANSATPFQSPLPESLLRLDLEIAAEKDGLNLDSQITLLQPKRRTVSYSFGLGGTEENQHPALDSLTRILDSMPNLAKVDTEADVVFSDINDPIVGPQTLTWLGIGPIQYKTTEPSAKSKTGETENADPSNQGGLNETGDIEDAIPNEEIDNGVANSDPENKTDADENAEVTKSGKPESEQQETVTGVAVPRSSKGPFLLDRREPLLEGVTLDGVFWGGIMPGDLPGIPLVSTGSINLMTRQHDGVLERLSMNIDLARSNLLSSHDWPILISNVLELARERLPGLRAWNYQIGESINFRLSPEQFKSNENQSLQLKFVLTDGEVGEKVIARLPEIDIPPLSSAGVYEIVDNEVSFDSFAVNFFDAEESNLRGLGEGEKIGLATAAQTPQARETNLTWLWWLLLITAAGAMILDWLVLRPRKNA